MGIIKAYKLTDGFDFDKIKKEAVERFRAKVLKEVVIFEKNGNHCFLFKYGVAIFWDFEEVDYFLKQIHPSLTGIKTSEDYNYMISQSLPVKIEFDTIYMDSDDELRKLSISYAIEQSIKLEEFETSIKRTLEETEHIPLDLAENGRVKMSRKELAKKRGRLFITKSDIYLHFELLDTPEFFWEYPELDIYYQSMRKYLELQPRIEILNRKMGVIQEILNILADEQNHKHSSTLEWIIIILIAIEIVLFIGYDL
ncbi:MAG TPA: RMD1 family protein [Sulfurovum sp.]|uniref:RMD1 family protein n=1 Tax=Sulfurovum sp. TaxID=1969726 RepID=UPI002F93EF71